MGIRRYTLNEKYFDKIDCPEKAYWLGYLYADGNVTSGNKRKYTVRLFADIRDRECLEKLSIELGSNKPIYWSKPSVTGQMGCVEFCSRHLVQSVIKLGLIPSKTFKLTFPTFLQPELQRHFIRGYLDGDGSISAKQPNLSFVGTKEFCLTLKKIIDDKFSTNATISIRHKERDNNIRQLAIGGRHKVKAILDWLYADATCFLERKYLKYKEISSEYNKRYIVNSDGSIVNNKYSMEICRLRNLGRKHSLDTKLKMSFAQKSRRNQERNVGLDV